MDYQYEQVKFRDYFESDETPSKWTGGIGIFTNGYKLVGIICGCCGGFIDPEDIAEYEILPWVNIQEEIRGDE